MNIQEPVEIYIDGSAKPNPGAGGFAVFMLLDGHTYLQAKGYPERKKITNNQMELMAGFIGVSLLSTHRVSPEREIIIYTDSRYLQTGITKWLNSWVRNGWKNSSGEDVKNKELWQGLDEMTKAYPYIRWKWVKGHSGNRYNELVDMLATVARKETEKKKG
jgi:ribonuclease HI